MGIFEWFRSHGERRGGPRICPCNLVAYYWTGATPEPRLVRDIGISGAFIEAPEIFYPGTLIQMALVDQSGSASGPEGRIFVCAKALERRMGGFSVCFPFLAGKERRAMRHFVEGLKDHAASRLAQSAGLADKEQSVVARVRPVETPADPVTLEEKAAVAFHSTEAVPDLTWAPEEPKEDLGSKASNGDPTRGQALIEFALILPLLFLLIVNVVNFGMFIFAWISVSGSARSGAQYLAQGGAMAGGLVAPSLTAVQTFTQNDLLGLPNGSTAQVRVCRVDGTLSCVGPGAQTPPVESAEPGPSGTTRTYSPGSVDITYTYTPIIPLWSFPRLNISATLPPLTIHRQAAMRALQ
jgi:Flp pilus assembly protein TadG